METLGDAQPHDPNGEPFSPRPVRPTPFSTEAFGLASFALAVVGAVGSFALLNVSSFYLYGAGEQPSLLRQYVVGVLPQAAIAVVAVVVGLAAHLRGGDETPRWAWGVAHAGVVLGVIALVLLLAGGIAAGAVPDNSPPFG